MNSLSRYLLFLSIILILPCCKNHTHDEDHDEDHERLSEGIILEPEMVERFGVEFETVALADFNDVIKTSGSIETSGSDIFTETARKAGIINLSPGIEKGAKVDRGQKIGVISSDDLQGGDATKVAISNLNVAKSEYERLKALFDDGLVTATDFKEAERAYREAEAIVGKTNTSANGLLLSPADGNIIELNVRSGEFVDVGAAVAVISKNLNQTLKADLPLRQSTRLTEIVTANVIPEGSERIIKLSELNGKRISGNSTAGNSGGYIPVYFSFNGNSVTTPSGFAEVYLICGKRSGVISVPRSALIEIQGNKYAYVETDEHSFEKRLVKTGGSDGERIEILEGISEGDKLVAKGASVLRMIEVSAIAPPSHNHNH